MFLSIRSYFINHWHSILLGILLTLLAGLSIFLFDKDTDTAQTVSEETELEVTVFDPTSLLVAPEPGEGEEYNKRVAEFAKEDRILSIGKDCSIEPLILKLGTNSIISIENGDNVGHSILFEHQTGDDLSFSLPSRSVLDFTPRAFGLSKGTYRYRCDSTGVNVNNGVMYVID